MAEMVREMGLNKRLGVFAEVVVILVVLALIGVSGYFVYRFLKPVSSTPITQIGNAVNGSLPTGSNVFNNPVIVEAFISVAGKVSSLDANQITIEKEGKTYSFKLSPKVKYYSSISGLTSPSLADIQVGSNLAGLLKLVGTEFVATTINLLAQ